MGKAHSGDLRERVYGEIAGGQSRRSAARRFGVSASTGVRLARRMIETGSLEPARQGRPPGGGKLAPYRELLIGWVEAEKDITMPELAVRLAEQCEVNVHPASLSRFLRGAGYSFTKNAAGERSRSPGRGRGPPDLADWRPASNGPRAAPAGVRWRDGLHKQTDPPARPGAARRTCEGKRSDRPLVPPDLHRPQAIPWPVRSQSKR